MGTGIKNVLSTNHSYHIEMVKQGGYAYLTEITASEQARNLDCSLVIMPEKIPFFYFAIALNKGSVFTKDISKM